MGSCGFGSVRAGAHGWRRMSRASAAARFTRARGSQRPARRLRDRAARPPISQRRSNLRTHRMGPMLLTDKRWWRSLMDCEAVDTFNDGCVGNEDDDGGRRSSLRTRPWLGSRLQQRIACGSVRQPLVFAACCRKGGPRLDDTVTTLLQRAGPWREHMLMTRDEIDERGRCQGWTRGTPVRCGRASDNQAGGHRQPGPWASCQLLRIMYIMLNKLSDGDSTYTRRAPSADCPLRARPDR